MQPTRRKLSNHVADQIVNGNGSAALRELAAELVHSKRTKELDLIVRDIERALATHDLAIVDVASAHQLSASSRDAIKAFIREHIAVKTVELREHVDESLLGGFHVRVAGKEIDATLAQKITQLKAQKV